MKSNRTRNTVLLCGLALVALAAAGWFFFLSPRLSQADALRADASSVEAANLQLQNRYNQTLHQTSSATQAASEAQALFSTMPEEADLPAVLTQISNAATSAGIKPQDISVISTSVPKDLTADPRKAKDHASAATAASQGASLAQMDISLTVNGQRQQLLQFLTNLQALDRAVLVTSSELTSTVVVDKAGHDLKQDSLKVTGSMFVLQSKLPDLVANVQKLLAEAQAASA
jgi:Tfp pilus assembly protein PilO